MKVMEIFNACQGEGQFIGQPSTFIRLFGCNLRCKWCDTSYSINHKEWKASGLRGKPYREMTIVQIVQEPLLPHVVITGGEPLIHKELDTLAVELLSYGHRVTIETNATLKPNSSYDWPKEVLWSLSPKLSSAGVGEANLDVLRYHLTWHNCQLKFVISDSGDLDEALLLCQIFEGHEPMSLLLRQRIILQPEGSALAAYSHAGVRAYLSRLDALQVSVMNTPEWHEFGWNVQVLPQLHILMHGRNRRFV